MIWVISVSSKYLLYPQLGVTRFLSAWFNCQLGSWSLVTTLAFASIVWGVVLKILGMLPIDPARPHKALWAWQELGCRPQKDAEKLKTWGILGKASSISSWTCVSIFLWGYYRCIYRIIFAAEVTNDPPIICFLLENPPLTFVIFPARKHSIECWGFPYVSWHLGGFFCVSQWLSQVYPYQSP